MSPSRKHTPVPTSDGFAIRLRQAQTDAGLKNEDLARILGISVRLLQRWRSGQGQPSGANLVALARALGRNASWFYADSEGAKAA